MTSDRKGWIMSLRAALGVAYRVDRLELTENRMEQVSASIDRMGEVADEAQLISHTRPRDFKEAVAQIAREM